MEMKIFTVFDDKTLAYLRPFYSLTEGEAIRSFSDTVNDPESMFHKHAADYTLFEIGVYDDQNGIITSCPHKSLGCALQYRGLPDDLQKLTRPKKPRKK